MPSTVAKINPDIAKERETASFNVEEFAIWWHGGAEKLKEKREIINELASDPELTDEVPLDYLSFQDQYDNSVRKATKLAKNLMRIQNQRNPGGNNIFPWHLVGPIAAAFTPLGVPFGVHFVMFIPTIERQGTPDQLAKWMPRATKCQIIGTYAQTELGHGTFVRGLETRADYDPKTEEFVLNSPTLTAYKWWPGGLGHTVNHAVIVAQLYINNKNHGLQMFIVQLRDEETHMPMEGVHIGEIGNKLGFKGVNNGFLGFKNVRIPRLNMLMRNAQVHADGTFVRSPAAVLTYFTMVFVRVLIVQEMALYLSQASTIATRYSAIRRQSVINPKDPEHQIIDHVTQQLKLFPEIAKSVAIRLGGVFLNDLYDQISSEINEGNLDRLAEIHALSCCLKAVSTTDTSAGIETLRLACGGHGFMLSSNFACLYSFATASVTYEGENTVVLLQTSRYLMKAWANAVKGNKLVPTVAYLKEAVQATRFRKWDGSLECLVKALQFTAANKIRVAYEHLMEKRKQGLTPEEAANATSIELVQAADLHGRSFLATIVWEKLAVQSNQHSPNFNAVLLDLLELYLVNAVYRNLSDVLRFVYLTDDDLTGLQTSLEQVLARLRPNAVAIVDGFDFHDRLINSALGSYDGNVYERIFKSAQASPMNKIPVQKSFHDHLKPFMKSNM